MDSHEWIPLGDDLPSGEVLVLVDGRVHVATLVENAAERGFMDARSDRLLPRPTHWMPIPLLPRQA